MRLVPWGCGLTARWGQAPHTTRHISESHCPIHYSFGRKTRKTSLPSRANLAALSPSGGFFVACTGRVGIGLSWNLNNGVVVLGPAEPVQHNDRISLSAGALLKSKDVYPACGGSLDWKLHPQSSSHACLPASSPHLLQSPDHI